MDPLASLSISCGFQVLGSKFITCEGSNPLLWMGHVEGTFDANVILVGKAKQNHNQSNPIFQLHEKKTNSE